MSEQFNIGDDVIVVNDQYIWLDPLPHDTILKVVNDSDSSQYVNDDEKTIEIQALRNWPDDFQVVSKLEETLSVPIDVTIGDHVEVLVPLERFAKEQTIEVGTVLKVVEDKPGPWFVKGDTIEIGAMLNHRDKFKLVPTPKAKTSFTTLLNVQLPIGAIFDMPETIIPMTRIESEETVSAEDVGQFVEDRVKEIIQPQLGVYRPQLETRKVGKVPMHMVIDGFPRALREVAKVMGWAADVKGYKLHDWKNLPDADIEFPSAGNRHMIDNSIMKSEGTSAIDRVDHESNLVHLAHEVFNKLAELELILTGKIK